MTTGFNTQIIDGMFQLQFETDKREYYEYVQAAARECLDGKATDKCHRWISVKERLPEHWSMDDKGRTLINYLVYSPDYGVDVGNYIKSAKRWVCMGLPMNVTHWMPLPKPPEVTKP